MSKYIALGMATFFLWVITSITQNNIKHLSELGFLNEAQSLITPMWLFLVAFAISLITLVAIAIRDITKAGE